MVTKRLLFIFTCYLCTIYGTVPFVPTRYRQLLNRSHITTEKRKDLLIKKLKIYTKEQILPSVGIFGLSAVQRDTIKKARSTVRQQLEAQLTRVNQRIQSLQEKQKNLKAIKNETEETQLIQELTLQQKIDDLQETIEGINSTQTFIEQQNVVGVPTLIQNWSTQRTALDEQLKKAQTQLATLRRT